MKKHEDQRDIFNTRWVIVGVVAASLIMPIVSSCGVRGPLHHPRGSKNTSASSASSSSSSSSGSGRTSAATDNPAINSSSSSGLF